MCEVMLSFVDVSTLVAVPLRDPGISSVNAHSPTIYFTYDGLLSCVELYGGHLAAMCAIHGSVGSNAI